MNSSHPPRRRPRRQPHPVRPVQHRLRRRLQPGDADRGHRRAGGPLRPRGRAARRGRRRRGAQARPRLQPDPRVGARLEAVAETPATDIQQACGTGLQAAIQVANKIALGQIDVGIAGGTDTTSDAPVAISDKLRKKLMKVNAARDTKGKLTALGADPPRRHRPGDPAERRAPHPAVDGRARRPDRAGVADHPRGPGRAGRLVAPARWRRRTTAASSTTRSRRSAGSSGTTTCGPTPRSRSSPPSSRSSAGARRPP